MLLAVTTGLRRGDIEAIRIGDIHFDRNTIATRNRKAGKAMPERPIPEAIMTDLSNYVATLADGQERLFTDRFSPKRWEKIRKAVRLARSEIPRSAEDIRLAAGAKGCIDRSDSTGTGTLQPAAYE